jgi:prevent-host-death family protein
MNPVTAEGRTTTMTSREFNQTASEAKRAANKGPVIITDRGRPAHVLMSMALYQRLTGGQQSIADLLAMPAGASHGANEDIDFDPPRLRDLPRPAELS